MLLEGPIRSRGKDEWEMIIKIKVRPNSGKQKIVKNGESYDVYLKSSPENNKANVELLKLLQRHFDKKVRIKSGLKSRIKTIELK